MALSIEVLGSIIITLPYLFLSYCCSCNIYGESFADYYFKTLEGIYLKLKIKLERWCLEFKTCDPFLPNFIIIALSLLSLINSLKPEIKEKNSILSYSPF